MAQNIDLKLIRLTENLYVNPAQISQITQGDDGRLQIHIVGLSGKAGTIQRDAASRFLDKLGGFISPIDEP